MSNIRFEKQKNGLFRLYIDKSCKGENLTLEEVLKIISEDEQDAQTIPATANK